MCNMSCDVTIWKYIYDYMNVIFSLINIFAFTYCFYIQTYYFMNMYMYYFNICTYYLSLTFKRQRVSLEGVPSVDDLRNIIIKYYLEEYFQIFFRMKVVDFEF